ncbi:MAG: hypothetical protein LC775_13170 [Acidobacteria bacterium]|nr:hypothetical protein [Acidobacteriota bacterium]
MLCLLTKKGVSNLYSLRTRPFASCPPKTGPDWTPSVIFSGQEIRTASEGALRLDRSAYLRDHDRGTEFVEDAARVTGAAGGYAARVDLHLVR